MIAGGGGVGKTFLMLVLSRWVEKLLRRAGDDPTNPKCLLLAPTGVAASLIGELFFQNTNELIIQLQRS